ncbi:AraC family transcriptional regulator ligand-binding domain-containing protein [Duganella sp. LX20W]|uniref:AraC family transcriptional regulator ligand-binding domain-containing protein n=1 Tax=Rugamonas brunnea TaxID=2758569 RepID=A0A7W2EUU0_9BURK|nr:AraC family transcriptional regulator [Rugamonas brunnea]MBA5638965.1 AraC family transcriptional regulator ligand-binding domain-containing protein [Rugamonas brunnea]
MHNAEHFVPARYFAQLIDYLEAHGTPCRDALSAAQIRSLNDLQAKLTRGQIDTLLTEVARLTGRGDLGFELGRQIKLNSHDVVGYGLISSATIDQALHFAARYYRLIMPLFTLRYQRREHVAEVLFQPVTALARGTVNFYLEMLAVSAHVQLMALCQGRIGPYDIHLAMAEPEHVQRYRGLQPARLHFHEEGVPTVRILMPTDILDQPLPMHDQRAFRQAEARCKQMIQECRTPGEYRGWIEMMLREAHDCQPTLDDMARQLNVSARTLDRYLEQEGASYRELATRTRNERAKRLLDCGKYAVSEIAYQLGYSDVANFSRSFKRLNGVPPSAYRRCATTTGAAQALGG